MDQFGQTATTADQVGAVKKVTRNGAGDYTLVANKTYTKLKCTGNCRMPGTTGDCVIGSSMYSANSTSVNLFTIIGTTEAQSNAIVTLTCQGSY